MIKLMWGLIGVLATITVLISNSINIDDRTHVITPAKKTNLVTDFVKQFKQEEIIDKNVLYIAKEISKNIPYMTKAELEYFQEALALAKKRRLKSLKSSNTKVDELEDKAWENMKLKFNNIYISLLEMIA